MSREKLDIVGCLESYNVSSGVQKSIMKEIKNQKEDLLTLVEKEFAIRHSCDCDKWCSCWDEFKARLNKCEHKNCYPVDGGYRVVVMCKDCGVEIKN